MALPFLEGELNVAAYSAEVRPFLAELVGVRVHTRSQELGSVHLMLAVARRAADEVERLLGPALSGGGEVVPLLERVGEHLRGRHEAALPPSSLSTASLTTLGSELLGAVHDELPAERGPIGKLSTAQILLRLALRHVSEEEREMLGLFLPVDDALDAVSRAVQEEPQAEVELFTPDGALGPCVSDSAVLLLEDALRIARATGHETCQPSHLALACLDSRDALVKKTLRVFGDGGRISTSRRTLRARMERGAQLPGAPLQAGVMAPALDAVLRRARPAADGRFGAASLFLALIANVDLDPFLADELRNGPLRLDVESAIDHMRRTLADPGAHRDVAVASLPAPFSACENLTHQLRSVGAERYVERPEAQGIVRGLFARPRRCVALHGSAGVGRSALVESVVCRASTGAIPLLSSTKFARVDAARLDPDGRRSFVLSLLSAKAPDLVLVVEDLHLLLEADSPGFLRAVRQAPELCLLGITTTAEYRTRTAADPDLKELLWPVELQEPDRVTTTFVLEAVAPELEARHGVSIDRAALAAIACMADDFVTSEKRPKRAVTTLELGCDEASFAIRSGVTTSASVDLDLTARALAQRSGVDVELLVGRRPEEYYERELSRRVVGQPEAVRAMACAIRLAKGGVQSADRPAGTFLYAGESGTGKTLMAKHVASVYSASKRLHIFPMGDFKESHSVARLVGAPPGYKGYDEGGGLVNALLDEATCVLLFDEVEKAHPTVLDALLRLCDEGTVKDAAGRVARTDRALVVMTSNLCQEAIAAELAQGRPMEQVAERVRHELRRARRPDGERYFRPEFLNRFDGILVFRPLGEVQIEEIARIEIEDLVKATLDQRSIALEPASGDWNELAGYLARSVAADPRRGRAVGHALRQHVQRRLAGIPVEGRGPRTVRVLVARESGREVVRLKAAESGQGPGGTIE